VIVIAILGILSASVSVFIANPVRAYFETIDRAALTAAGKLGGYGGSCERLQGAVPNSARITATAARPSSSSFDRRRRPLPGRSQQQLSDPERSARRHRLDRQSFPGAGPTANVPTGSQLVVLNLGYGNANLYSGTNIRTVTSIGAALQTITFTPTTAWPPIRPATASTSSKGP